MDGGWSCVTDMSLEGLDPYVLALIKNGKLTNTNNMTLYLVGLGLGDEKDITVKGLETVKKCKSVYLESYTSILGISRERLEAFYGRPVIDADRDFVEQSADTMLDEASQGHEVAMLVVGDPFGATTHADLVLRAREKNIKVEVIHNASIMNAIGATGLQLYIFGQAVSIPFWTDTWKPTSFYDKIKLNANNGFHTLCLLDIKVKEQSIENLMKGRKIYEPPRFMTTMQCIDQLIEAEQIVKENILGSETKCFAVARIGQPTQAIVSGTLEELRYINLGAPLHSFIICGPMHLIEEDFYKFYHVSNYLKDHPDAIVIPKPDHDEEEDDNADE